MSASSKTGVCPKCGRALPPDAPQGLCTRCLVGAMLETGPLASALHVAVGKSLLPRTFGAYELLEEVARGGMGIVYKARQLQINRVVAVKVMAAGQFAAPDFVKRFRTEAETAASLDHPNIVPIYEVGECEGQPFFSMKFVERGSLAGRISSRGFHISERQTAVWVAKLARAVHYAHQRGILHRDIKPGNVLLDAQGEPQLTDFGLAKLVEKDSTLTRTLAMLGTPSYMSPEQARGEAKQLTTAVDVYGLGAVFYELLTGQPPFAGGTTMETVRQVLEREPRRPSAVKPGVDRDLETICLKCLEKDPARRYGSAEALADDLARWERHEPVVARRPSALYRFQKAWRRNKLTYSAALAVVLALVAGLGLAALGWGQAERSRIIAAQQRDLAQDRLYDSLVREAHSIRIIRSLGYRQELIDRLRQALAIPTAKKNTDVLRSEFAQCLGDALSLNPVNLVDPPAPASILDYALDPHGMQLALATSDGGLVLYDTATGAVLTHLVNQGRIVQLAFTQDGQSLFARVEPSGDRQRATIPQLSLVEWHATNGAWWPQSIRPTPNLRGLLTTKIGMVMALEDVSRHEIRLLEAGTDRLVDTVPLALGRGFPLAFDLSFDQSLAAFTTEPETNRADSAIEVWDLAARKRRIRLTPGLGLVPHLEFSRDGRFLACTGDNGVIAYETSEFKPITTYRGYMSTRAAWTSDGTTLAIPLAQENGVRLFGVASATELTRLTTRGQGVKELRTSLDGSVLVTVDYGGAMLAVHLVETRERLRLIGHAGGVPGVEFSPDGKHVASTGKDETIRLWDAATGKATQVWNDQHAEGQTVCFSPDGRWLASGNYRNNQILVWSIEDGRRVLELGNQPAGGAGTWSCAFSPDGRTLLAVGNGLRAWELILRSAGTIDSPLEARALFSEAGDFRNLQVHSTGKWIAFDGNLRREGHNLSGSFIRGLEPGDQPEWVDSHPAAVQTIGFLGSPTLLNMDVRDRTLRVWDVLSRRIVRTLPTLSGGETGSTYVGNLRVSPDGSKVAVANQNGLGVNIYDVASGRRLYSLPDEPGSIWWLAWAPDNSRLAVSRGNGDISLWNLPEVEAALTTAGL